MAQEDETPDEGLESEQSEQAEANRQGYALRQAEKRASKAEEALKTIQRERAFEKAGIDPEDAKFKYFVQGYDGELTADAVKAEAVAVGLLEAEKTVDPVDGKPELSTQEKIAAASQGGGPPLTGKAAAEAAMDEAYKQGGTPALLQQMAAMGMVIADNG